MVFSSNWRGDIFVFSVSAFFFFLFFSVLCFFKSFVCEIIVFILKLFLKFLVAPCTLHFFVTKKKAPRKNIFSLFFNRFFCFTLFFLHHFSLFFLSSILSFITFSFHLFVHLLLLFSPSSFLSFLHSSSISLSPCFSFSFFSISSLLIFFLHRRCCVSSFCFNSFLFSLFCS